MVNPLPMQRRAFFAALLRAALPATLLESGCTAAMNWKVISGTDVEGKGWEPTLAAFDRLPAHAEKTVPPSVWNLSHHSAGLCYRFVTDAPQIGVRWSVTGELAMPHMPATGVSGVDLYARDLRGRWRFVQVGQPRQKMGNEAVFPAAPPGEKPGGQRREFRLYFPLYNALAHLEVGVEPPASLLTAPLYPTGKDRPIVFYGTSITQGGCASRPGLAFTAQAARLLERAHLNLGFSGNGKMELALADLFGELNPAVLVLDCLRNMSEAQVAERMEPFLLRLREKHAQIPILCAGDAFLDNAKEPTRSRLTRESVERLNRSGVGHLHYLPMRGALGDDGEATVDSVHPNDIGMQRQAVIFAKALRPLL